MEHRLIILISSQQHHQKYYEYDTTPKQATECSNMTSTASITCLPRYTLSVILSYLQPPDPAAISNGKFTTETDNFNYKYHHDGVALLLTTKQLTSSILPLFRVPKRLCRIYKYPAPQCAVENEKSNSTNDVTTINKTIVIVEKYRFMVLPIQDPRTLLDRLNTRRLKQRVSWIKGLQSEQCEEEANKQVQSREGNLQDIHQNGQEVTLGDTSGNFNTSIENACNNDNSTGDKRLSNEISYYQKGRTIEELALEEWAMMEIHHGDGTLCGHKNCMADNNTKWRVWPAHLELLRFLDDINFEYDDGFEGSEDKNMFVNAKTKSKLLSSLSLKSKPSGSGNSQGITDSMSGVNSLGRDTFGEGVTLLASYPRSGNTLLRTLLERITSIVTGSDTRPDRTLSRSLAQEHDLVGEGLLGKHHQSLHSITKSSSLHSTLKSKPTTDHQNVFQSAYEPRVHIVKTHFPERKGWKTVNAKRALLLVRNPYDAIDSYWNLCCTNTHTRSLDESVYKQYVDKFESLARHEITVWCEFHYHWLDVCEKEGVPLLIMRYEDLVLDTDGEMKRLLKFLMDREKDDTNAEVSDVHMGDLKKGFGVGNNLSDFWDWRISHAIGNATTNAKAAQSKTSDTNSTNTSRLGSYQPRSSGGGLLSIGKTLRKHRYSESVLLHMHDVAVSLAIARKEKLSKKKLGPTAPWGKISNILNSSANPSLLPHKKQQYNMTLLQMFGYDVYSQNFPENILKPLQVSLDELTNSFKRIPSQQGLVEINNTTEIRKKDDPYGRAMTAWRRGETNGDTTPFATVAR